MVDNKISDNKISDEEISDEEKKVSTELFETLAYTVNDARHKVDKLRINIDKLTNAVASGGPGLFSGSKHNSARALENVKVLLACDREITTCSVRLIENDTGRNVTDGDGFDFNG